MLPMQHSKSLRHFTKNLFLVSKVHVSRSKAKEDVSSHLQNMRKSIIRMRLSYTDIDKLKKKLDNLIEWERKYAKFFKIEDDETRELKNQINALEQELRKEKEEKQRMAYENSEKVRQLTESLNNIKAQMNHLLMERAKRHHRLKALENKIRQKVDVHSYYHS